jgi:branched-chain amino acid transport system permease protein
MDFSDKKENDMQLKEQIRAFLHTRAFQLLVVSFVILSVIPIFVTDKFLLLLFTLIFIFSIYASSWNFLANSGQGSLGHAAFLGIGGFTSAIIGNKIAQAVLAVTGGYAMPLNALSLTIQLSVILVGGLISAGIGLLIGLACVRLKAWYLAMVTFGFSVIAFALSTQFDFITNGNQGFSPLTLVTGGFPFYILVVAFSALSITAMYLIMKSRMGLAFRAIKDNEAEARMIGINTTKYKLTAFVISTFFAGIAGGLYVYCVTFVDNNIFSPANSFLPLIMTVIGGLGTLSGPIIGAVFLTSIEQILNLQSVKQALNSTIGPLFPNVGYAGPPLTFLIIGIILLLIVIFSPSGLTHQLRKIYTYIVTEDKEGKKK